MKLYVWANPYKVPYGTTMVFAVAESIEDAKVQARKGDAYAFCEYPDSQDAPRALDLGRPTRIVDLPCAEWHRWEE